VYYSNLFRGTFGFEIMACLLGMIWIHSLSEIAEGNTSGPVLRLDSWLARAIDFT
jgi:hypothetical protein